MRKGGFFEKKTKKLLLLAENPTCHAINRRCNGSNDKKIGVG